MHDRPIGEVRASVRRCSLISAGPVAQLSPMRSIPNGAKAVSAAPISVPSSIVPVVSTVTWAKTGISDPVARRARRAPTMAAFVCSRSCDVSMSTASAPPATMPRTCVSNASRSRAYGA
ncbi:MAG: hypothetical protein U0R65_01360 [Candidatus Nanopelagicales bacterium]